MGARILYRIGVLRLRSIVRRGGRPRSAQNDTCRGGSFNRCQCIARGFGFVPTLSRKRRKDGHPAINEAQIGYSRRSSVFPLRLGDLEKSAVSNAYPAQA